MDLVREEQAVRAAWEKGNSALEEGDWERYSDFWAHGPHVEILHPARGEWLRGWREVGSSYRELLIGGPSIKGRTRDMRIHVSPSGEMAWGTAEVDLSFVSEGDTVRVSTWQTVVFEKLSGSWKLVHGHVSIPGGGGQP